MSRSVPSVTSSAPQVDPSRPDRVRRMSAVCDRGLLRCVGALLIAASTPFAGVLVAGCERSPAGPLQLPVPSSSPPPTPAFASNSLRTSEIATTANAGVRTSGDSPPAVATGTTARGATAPSADFEQTCSVAGLLQPKQISEDHFEIKRADIHAIINALRERAKAASDDQLTPMRTETGVPGLRVQSVGTKANCGLQSGDILVSLNGIPVIDQSRLAQNREKLRTAEEIKLVIERDRKSKLLTYDVR